VWLCLSGPTFEDLLFDDALDDLQRVKTYTASRIALQRLVHVKMLANVAEEFEFDKLEESLFPVLDKLTSDEEFVIRQHLAEQIRGLAAVCASTPHPNGYRVLVEQLLYLLGKLAADNMAEVRIAAGETLVAVAKLVKPDDLGPRVLTIVLQLAHDDIHEDLRMTAVRWTWKTVLWNVERSPSLVCTSLQAVLLNELAETLGPDLCHQFVVPEVICLSEDAIFRVRKAAALNMDAVCRTAGLWRSPPTRDPCSTHCCCMRLFTGAALCNERLLPAFVKLSKDDVWGVRKACAESLVAVSKSIDPSSRITVRCFPWFRFSLSRFPYVVGVAVAVVWVLWFR
jgi:serine/threonine-protein phosphatase 4 regulatory subunit 1